MIYTINPADGSIIDYISSSQRGTGLTYDGNNFRVLDPYNRRVYTIDPLDGSTISYFGGIAKEAGGLTYDGTYLWYTSDDSVEKAIYKINASDGTEIAHYANPSGDAYAWGVAWQSGHPVPTATIYVPDNYTKIQWAVDNATDGDTIIVRIGTYHENVVVNKSITLKGVDKNSTIINGSIDGNQTKPVIEVEADNCVISGFTVMAGYSGISLDCSNNCTITNNSVKDCMYVLIYPPFPVEIGAGEGIYLSHSYNNTITGNEVSNNIGKGISLRHSARNTISNNFICNFNHFA